MSTSRKLQQFIHIFIYIMGYERWLDGRGGGGRVKTLKITSCNSYSFPLNPLPTKPDPVMEIPLQPPQRAISVTNTRTLCDSVLQRPPHPAKPEKGHIGAKQQLAEPNSGGQGSSRGPEIRLTSTVHNVRIWANLI
jgi:hypothetical protein